MLAVRITQSSLLDDCSACFALFSYPTHIDHKLKDEINLDRR